MRDAIEQIAAINVPLQNYGTVATGEKPTLRCRVEPDRITEIRGYRQSSGAEYRGFVTMPEPPTARLIEKPCNKVT